MIPEKTNSTESGFTLIVVLGFLFVVTLMITPFVTQTRNELFIGHTNQTLERLEFLANGLVDVLAMRILSSFETSELPFSLNGVEETCRVGGFNIQVKVQDHRGLIDLNTANISLLKLGFQSTGMSDIVAETHAKTVIHLRSPFSGPAPLGVFSTHTNRRLGRFASALELMDIASTHRLNHRVIARTFTVHTGAGILRTDLAPPPLINALEERVTTGNPLTSDNQPTVPNGIYTIEITLLAKKKNLFKSISSVVAIGVHNNRPSQLLEHIPPEPIRTESRTQRPDGCGEIFGSSVNDIVQAME